MAITVWTSVPFSDKHCDDATLMLFLEGLTYVLYSYSYANNNNASTVT